MRKTLKLKLYKSKDLKWYFTIVSTNGRVLSTSETYSSKQAAQKSMDLISGCYDWEILNG